MCAHAWMCITLRLEKDAEHPDCYPPTYSLEIVLLNLGLTISSKLDSQWVLGTDLSLSLIVLGLQMQWKLSLAFTWDLGIAIQISMLAQELLLPMEPPFQTCVLMALELKLSIRSTDSRWAFHLNFQKHLSHLLPPLTCATTLEEYLEAGWVIIGFNYKVIRQYIFSLHRNLVWW